MKWIVSTPARLHFGLLDLAGDLGRIDGGAGVAISEPRVVVRAWTGPTKAAALPDDLDRLARRLSDRLRIDYDGLGVQLELLGELPRHVGLGSHTQLALAVGKALSKVAGRDLQAQELADAASRGGTSGVGVHCFGGGGLVIDGGHSFGPGKEKERCGPSSASRAQAAPLLARYELPESWRFALVTPMTHPGANGSQEVALFDEAFPMPQDEVGRVARQVLVGLMPGGATKDVELLGRALTGLQSVGFKRREVALQPRPVQELLTVLVEAGAAGAGLSSFGPTVYGLVGSQAVGEAVIGAAQDHLERHGIESRSWLAAPDNVGATISQES